MAELGKRNLLTVVREGPPGYFLDDGEGGEILLPGKYIPVGSKPGETLDVFIYRDSEDRLVATTETPLAMVGDFAALKVVDPTRPIGKAKPTSMALKFICIVTLFYRRYNYRSNPEHKYKAHPREFRVGQEREVNR